VRVKIVRPISRRAGSILCSRENPRAGRATSTRCAGAQDRSHGGDEPTAPVFGFHAVLARLRADAASVTEIYLDEDRKRAARKTSPSPRKSRVSLCAFDKRLDGSTAAAAQGVVAMAFRKTGRARAWRPARLGEGSAALLVLDGEDPHNLGACLRVATRRGPRGDRTQGPCRGSISGGGIQSGERAADRCRNYMVTNLPAR